jgi:hypothetical protein
MATAAVRHKGRREIGDSDAQYRRIQARIQFPEESAWVRDMPVAAAFKNALGDALRFEDADRLRVRCSVARDEANGLRFMCKVDVNADMAQEGPAGHAWSWWSPLAERPEDLVAELRRALRLRQARLRAARPRPVIAATEGGAADKARGPAHGTFSTGLWDLGQNEQGEGFCRNRRGRWTTYAAGSRPLRPRYPR